MGFLPKIQPFFFFFFLKPFSTLKALAGLRFFWNSESSRSSHWLLAEFNLWLENRAPCFLSGCSATWGHRGSLSGDPLLESYFIKANKREALWSIKGGLTVQSWEWCPITFSIFCWPKANHSSQPHSGGGDYIGWNNNPIYILGFPCGSAGKESACSVGDLGCIPGWGRSPWRRERPPMPVFWPGESHGLDSPWGRKESDTTEWFSLSL